VLSAPLSLYLELYSTCNKNLALIASCAPNPSIALCKQHIVPFHIQHNFWTTACVGHLDEGEGDSRLFELMHLLFYNQKRMSSRPSHFFFSFN